VVAPGKRQEGPGATPYGGSLMRKVTLSIPVAVLALCLGAAQLPAQQSGSNKFQWYVGGQGGITSFRSPITGREFLPMGGGHILITARRTGLLLSVDQGFGSTQTTGTFFEIRDSLDNVTSAGQEIWNFKGIRRYSAMLVAYPVRIPNIQPYLGLGVGIAHTTVTLRAHSPADGSRTHSAARGFWPHWRGWSSAWDRSARLASGR